MIDRGADDTDRFRLLATLIAGRAVDVARAADGEPAHTNGQVIYVSATGSAAEQRRQVLAQSALIGAGSIGPQQVRPLRGRPSLARRYLALEGHRVLFELAEQLPLAAALSHQIQPSTATVGASLDMARSRAAIPDPPDWFGVIKPSRLLDLSGPGTGTHDKDLRFDVDTVDAVESEDNAEKASGRSRILQLFENPLMNSRLVSKFFRKLLGTSRSPGDNAAGAELDIRAIRHSRTISAHALPLPAAIRFGDDGMPVSVYGVDATLHPEWDAFTNRYRPDWCRVLNYPLTGLAEISTADLARDEVLRNRLARVGLDPRVLRGRPDGDELDIDALTDFVTDVRSGNTPAQHVYTERRKIARDLGVLILLDMSGSVTEADPNGHAVHEHQRHAAATLAATLEEVGDRVAVYAFRSEGRHAVHLAAIKSFEQRFGAAARGHLDQLQPSGYTRLGAAIRGAAEILNTQAGTTKRLLLVLSDGFPYDHGYEGHYAEADTRKALEELHVDAVACLCLAVGTGTAPQALNRVFGSANHVSAETLAELSPRMDELFLLALREIAEPRRGM